ncbi:Hypothetical predicted protein [Olea europaea subsp. europaea]|uniref:Uncharacterized protein n=1 Tax=Olea europaea subsp. europaea TaxID=158383 RepID=A0A8S0VI65_OLEEU|nr:Hypothetical predicted protein [Olea europaea subsp. europaea]
MGQLHHFLGIEMCWHESSIHLTQPRYIAELLKKFELQNVKPFPTPIITDKTISKIDGEAMQDPSIYRSAVGLQYLSHTRPNITFTVNKLSQFLQSPTSTHWQALKRVLRYLKGTMNQGLWIQNNDNLTLNGYSDADWASCPDDRRSTTGYCIYLGDNLIAWSSKKQHVVARSSTGSEYRALASAASEIAWIQSRVSCPNKTH